VTEVMPNVDGLFKGRHFEREIIILCVRWYLRYKLSVRDLVEMMAERGRSMLHTTITRWVQRYVPEFEKRWDRFARPVGRSWRVGRRNVRQDPRRMDVPIGRSIEVAGASTLC
jgi:transposase-like protein